MTALQTGIYFDKLPVFYFVLSRSSVGDVPPMLCLCPTSAIPSPCECATTASSFK